MMHAILVRTIHGYTNNFIDIYYIIHSYILYIHGYNKDYKAHTVALWQANMHGHILYAYKILNTRRVFDRPLAIWPRPEAVDVIRRCNWGGAGDQTRRTYTRLKSYYGFSCI